MACPAGYSQPVNNDGSLAAYCYNFLTGDILNLDGSSLGTQPTPNVSITPTTANTPTSVVFSSLTDCPGFWEGIAIGAVLAWVWLKGRR